MEDCYPPHVLSLLVQLESKLGEDTLDPSFEEVLIHHASKVSNDATLYTFYRKLNFDFERM
jgi:hypothetical protein